MPQDINSPIQVKIRQWWVYKITSPSGKVYIGKTCNISSRLTVYKNITKGCQSQPLIYNSLLRHGSKNHDFLVIDSFEGTQSFASGKEMFWIRSYMSNESKWRRGNGMNLSDGGEGTIGAKFYGRVSPMKGIKMSEEAKLHLSKYNQEHPSRGMFNKKHKQSSKDAMSSSKKGMISTFKGKHHTEEYKKWASESRIGKSNLKRMGVAMWSDEDKKRIGKSKIGNRYNIGRVHSKSVRENMMNAQIRVNGVGVLQYDLNGSFIKEYSGLRLASREINITRSSISKIASGYVKKPKKFIFKYKVNEFNS